MCWFHKEKLPLVTLSLCVMLCVWCLPARFQAGHSCDAAILSVDVKHALGLRLLGKRQNITGVTVGCIDLTNRATLEGICYHDNEDFQGGNSGLVLAVPDDPQKYPRRRGETWFPRVTCLREQFKSALRVLFSS